MPPREAPTRAVHLEPRVAAAAAAVRPNWNRSPRERPTTRNARDGVHKRDHAVAAKDFLKAGEKAE
jgi:hypothetical protein